MSSRDTTLRALSSRLRATPLGQELLSGLSHFELDALTAPDSASARAAEEVCRAASTATLTNHCFRSYAWGALLALVDDVRFDAELFYVASLLHDLGLTERYDTGRCFESDSAEAARDLLTSMGWDEGRTRTAADAIYLHMHDLPENPTSEALLLTLGTSADVSGSRALDIPSAQRDVVLQLFPRLGFKAHFTELFEDQAARKPRCVVHRYLHELDLARRIEAAPYED